MTAGSPVWDTLYLLNISERTVEVHIARAIRHIKSRLEYLIADKEAAHTLADEWVASIPDWEE